MTTTTKAQQLMCKECGVQPRQNKGSMAAYCVDCGRKRWRKYAKGTPQKKEAAEQIAQQFEPQPESLPYIVFKCALCGRELLGSLEAGHWCWMCNPLKRDLEPCRPVRVHASSVNGSQMEGETEHNVAESLRKVVAMSKLRQHLPRPAQAVNKPWYEDDERWWRHQLKEMVIGMKAERDGVLLHRTAERAYCVTIGTKQRTISGGKVETVLARLMEILREAG